MLIEATTKTVPPEERKGVETTTWDNQLPNKVYTSQSQRRIPLERAPGKRF